MSNKNIKKKIIIILQNVPELSLRTVKSIAVRLLSEIKLLKN